MKQDEKKVLTATTVSKPDQHAPEKQTSGDKNFDNAIDKMLKKPNYTTPSK